MRLIGRDIKRTIIIDNLKENFMSTCPYNGIEITSWYGEDLEDTELNDLIPFLKTIAQNEEKDVRKVLKHYEGRYAQYVADLGKDSIVLSPIRSDIKEGQLSSLILDKQDSIESARSTASLVDQFKEKKAKRKIIDKVIV